MYCTYYSVRSQVPISRTSHRKAMALDEILNGIGVNLVLLYIDLHLRMCRSERRHREDAEAHRILDVKYEDCDREAS